VDSQRLILLFLLCSLGFPGNIKNSINVKVAIIHVICCCDGGVSNMIAFSDSSIDSSDDVVVSLILQFCIYLCVCLSVCFYMYGGERERENCKRIMMCL